MDYKNISVKELEGLVEQKNSEAICELAYRCRIGIGVERNLTRAYQLYHKGEKQGECEAYYALSEMYRIGEGVAQSDELSRKYKELLPVDFVSKYENRTKNDTEEPSLEKIDLNEIEKMLSDCERNRSNNNTTVAKQLAKDALEKIVRGKNGEPVVGKGDLDVLQVEAYWLLSYIAFNEQNYSEMEDYYARPGVMALHPWGTYLCSIVHQMNNSPSSVFENDLQKMIKVKNNANMNMEQRGDLLGQIGDLYLLGVGGKQNNIETAYTYFEEASNCGNIYGKEQMKRFKRNFAGKIELLG